MWSVIFPRGIKPLIRGKSFRLRIYITSFLLLGLETVIFFSARNFVVLAENMSGSLECIPKVEIEPSGVFKYIMLNVHDANCPNIEPVTIVRGLNLSYHSDIYDVVSQHNYYVYLVRYNSLNTYLIAGNMTVGDIIKITSYSVLFT